MTTGVCCLANSIAYKRILNKLKMRDFKWVPVYI